MIKGMSIRGRLTILSVVLLSICCFGLTLILNHSAFKMVDEIESEIVEPARITSEANEGDESTSSYDQITPSPSTEAIKYNFRANSIFYMMVIIVLGGILTYYFSGKALEPLTDFSKQIKNIDINNLSDDIILPNTNDEILQLGKAFNEMIHKINDAFLMQKRFSQSAAHELRTPLAVLKTKVDVFKKRQTHTMEEYNSLVEIISSHTNRLSNLVKSLLDLTNFEELNLNENIYLLNLIGDVVHDLYLIAKNKSIEINIQGEEKSVLGNHDLLYRAFYNIIENSIKYNKDNGQIHIQVESQENNVIVAIADTGIGIPDNMKKDIFEPFFRVDKSRSRQVGGAGLGLSIVKSIIDKHNGIIEIYDNNHCGTVFKIKLQERKAKKVKRNVS